MAESFFTRDPALPGLLRSVVPTATYDRAEPWLARLGAQAATELDPLAAQADRHTPRLQTHDRNGRRVDEIHHDAAYHELCRVAFEEHGFAAMSHREGVGSWPGRVPHAVKYALSYEFVQAEFGLFCPISMTDSAARLLARHGDETTVEYLERLTSTDPAERVTGAMYMTEQQGGSDVGQTQTTAAQRGGEWRLSGSKWFCSNPGAEVVLTLARRPDGGTGTRGLGLFLVPRHRPDGSLNGMRIERLKDKLGARSFASAEVTLEGAYAIPVGPPERGFLTMTEMVNSSRLSNAMRSAAMMRRAVTEAVAHTRGREAFGRPLFDAPLMRQSLLPLIVTAEASLSLVLVAAEALQQSDDGDERGRLRARILTPLAKLAVTKRARQVVAEAMEVRGGNGYIEEWPEARLLRDAHLGSIWEGSSNVIALDVLRSVRRSDVLGALQAWVSATVAEVDRSDPVLDQLAAGALDAFDAARQDVLEAAERGDEPAAVAVSTALADAVSGIGLLRVAGREAAAGQGYRVASILSVLLEDASGLLGLPGARRVAPAYLLAELATLADGGHLDASTWQPAPGRTA